MRRFVGMTLLVTASVAAVAVPSSVTAHGRCASTGSRTLVETTHARVYRSSKHVAYACSKRTGRKYRLDNPQQDYQIQDSSKVRLAGSFVAYANHSWGDDEVDGGEDLTRLDLRDGRKRRLGGGVGSELTDIELSPKGFVGWIIRGNDRGPTVWKLDSRGRDRLDPGPGVSNASLALSGSLLYWTKNERSYSYRLR
jgi:hypothetical protein